MSGNRLGRPELREIARWAGALGWTWSHTGSGHIRWDHARVPHPVFTAATPRDRSGFKERQKLNTALRRADERMADAGVPAHA